MHWGCYSVAGSCDLAEAAEYRDRGAWQFGHIPEWGDKASGIDFFTAFCIVRGT